MTKIVFLLLVSVYYKAVDSFDCRLPEQDCVNGVCTFASPDCGSCAPGFEGYNCGLQTSLKGTGGCTATTCEAGDCYDDGTPKCYCPALKYGDTCNLDRFAVSCDKDFMVLGINPQTTAPFGTNGIAYIQGQRNVAACVASNVPSPASPTDDIPDTWLGQALKVNHNDCGQISAVNAGGKTTYTRILIVNFNNKLTTSSDNRFTAVCSFNDSGIVVESSVTKINTTDLGGLNEANTEGSFSPVTLVVTTGGVTVDPTKPVKVGDIIVFTFTIPVEYEDMRIETGIANNTKPVGDADAKELQLIDGSCVDDAAYHVTETAPALVTAGNLREISYSIKAFHFFGNEDVIFRFTVKVCLPAGDCDPVTCTNKVGGSGLGRKKRDINANEEILERVVKVVDPEELGKGEQTGKSDSECRTSEEITAALVAMGIVILVLLILTTILLGKFMMSRPSRAHSKQDLFSAQSVQSLPKI